MIDSVWKRSYRHSERRPRLRESIRADVAVIGGGMAGILIADALKQEGLSAVVLESRTVGSGQTGGTTAKITSQHGAIYHRLLSSGGEHAARLYASANQWAVRQYVDRIHRERIDCDLEMTDAYVYSLQSRELIEREYAAAKRIGLPVTLSDASGLPFEAMGAVRLSEQAQFHPLKFLFHVAKGLTVYENSPVVHISGTDVYTTHACVHAKKVVFACHYPFQNFPGLFFTRMHQEREVVLALENAPIPGGMWVCAEDGGYSLRRYGNLTLLGGMAFRTGENRHGGKGSALLEKAKQFFPDAREVCRWAAQDCITVARRPYIGRFCTTRPHWFVATGFGKWGMSTSMVAARIITELITEKASPWAAVYSPNRLDLANTPRVLAEAAHAVKGLAKVVFSLPNENVDKLAPGQGGVVFLNGKRAGVYKDLDGKIYAVRTVCPHLGCHLEWNPDEKTWDCPCHGSRFDYRGNLLDNPAQTNLKKY